jgi:hypothetical protein
MLVGAEQRFTLQAHRAVAQRGSLGGTTYDPDMLRHVGDCKPCGASDVASGLHGGLPPWA